MSMFAGPFITVLPPPPNQDFIFPVLRGILSQKMVFKCTKHSADRHSSSSLPGVWPHTTRRSTHLLQKVGWEVFNHPPYNPDLVRSDFHLFLPSRNSWPVIVNVYRMTEKRRWVSHSGSNLPGGRLLRHRDIKVVPEVNMLKSSSTSCSFCFNKPFH